MQQINIRGVAFNHEETQDYFWSAVSQKEWEEHTFDVLDNSLKEGGVFVDIGAWNGVLSLYAAGKGVQCYALEPDNKAFSLLSENIGLNPDLKQRIVPIQAAISDRRGFATLMSASGDWGNSMSSLLPQGAEPQHTQEINTVELSELFERTGIDIDNVNLVKIDVEGWEYKILPQARNFLSTYRPNIYLSLHPFWFPSAPENTAEIADIIFPMYRVLLNGRDEITRDQFTEIMSANVGVDVLLVKKNKVGLVIPVFNRPEYLSQCLDSISKLSEQPYQVILVDDCSTDPQTIAMINGCVGANIARHTINSGVKMAIRSGTEIAFDAYGCEYVIILDMDAIVKPSLITDLVNTHKKYGRICSAFNCPYKQAKETDGNILFKSNCNGINMCFDLKEYEKYILPALKTISGDWDNIASASYARDGMLFPIITPSLVQHIGMVSSMGHYPADVASDF